MKITSREKDIIMRAAEVLYNISDRADNKITEHYFEKIADILDQIWDDYSEDEDEDED